MNDLRSEYKNLVLHACRISVSAGAMTREYEDFVIDNLDTTVDGLTDEQFEHVVRTGKILVGDLRNDVEYDRTFDLLTQSEQALSGDLLESEREGIQKYRQTLKELTDEFKEREWG